MSEQRAHTEHAEMRLRVEEQERTIAQLEALLERQRLAEAAGAGARRPTTTERNAVSKNAALTAELSDLRARYNLLNNRAVPLQTCTVDHLMSNISTKYIQTASTENLLVL